MRCTRPEGTDNIPYTLKDEYRVVRRFLWRPKTLGRETRWLTFCRIKQRKKIVTTYCKAHFWTPPEWRPVESWIDWEFVD